MRIDIKKIETITSVLLAKLIEIKGATIELSHDYYWDIPTDDMYNPYQEPKHLTLGQLSDDLEELQRLCESSDDAIPYDLGRIASILKALSLSTWY